MEGREALMALPTVTVRDFAVPIVDSKAVERGSPSSVDARSEL